MEKDVRMVCVCVWLLVAKTETEERNLFFFCRIARSEEGEIAVLYSLDLESCMKKAVY